MIFGKKETAPQLKKTDPTYFKYVEIQGIDYNIKTKELEDGVELVCPNDPTMKVCKKDGKIFLKKKSRLNPF